VTVENALGPACDEAEAMSEDDTEAFSTRSIGACDEAPVTRRVDLFPWRKEIAASGLTSTQRLICHTLALHMDTKGGSCFPSTPLLASESGCSKRTVEIALAAIEAAGFIRRERGGGRGRGDKSTYQASVPERAKQVRSFAIEMGEADSPIIGSKGRRTFAGRANLTTQKGEADSPEEVRRTTGGRPTVDHPDHPDHRL
jgi:hypothetical protein